MRPRPVRLLALVSILAVGCAAPLPPTGDASHGIGNDGGFPTDTAPIPSTDAALAPALDGSSPSPADTGAPAPDAALPACTFSPVVPGLHDEVPMLLDYASVGDADNPRLLAEHCEHVLVVGDKSDRPSSRMRSDAVRSRGGRSGYVVGDNGRLLRGWLRTEGVAATAARLRARLDAGYDYIVVDEITADPEWGDTNEVSVRFRRLLDALPPGSVIAYVSIDLTQDAGGGQLLANRRWAMRALQRRGDRIALEVYLHTAGVIAGNAPGAFRTAADRLSSAVAGMEDADDIQRSALTVIGVSMHADYPQYRYLDQPAHDLSALDREVAALSGEAGPRVRAQRGVGYYFVTRSDITPGASAPYTLDDLIDHMARDAAAHLAGLGP